MDAERVQDVERRDDLEASAHEFDVMRPGGRGLPVSVLGGPFHRRRARSALGWHPVVVDPGTRELRASAPARIRLEDEAVYISGELDHTTAQLVGATWLAVGDTVTIDLAETSFFDVGAYRALRTIVEGGCQVTLRNAPPVVRRVVELRIEDEPIQEAV